MKQLPHRMMKFALSSGVLLLGAAAIAGCAARTAALPLTAPEHDALAQQAASHGDVGVAETHRVAAQDLRAAEEAACAGIPDAERNEGPFAKGEHVASVEPLNAPQHVGKWTYPVVVGSRITVPATPGLTRQWLTRLAECHVARHASIGPSIDEGRPCPLSTGGAIVRVDEGPNDFVLAIRSESGEQVAAEVLRRSEALRTDGTDLSAQKQASKTF